MEVKKNKELVVIWISLFVIVLLLVLFPFVKKGLVGKAFGDVYSATYPQGFYWEKAPVEGGALTNAGGACDHGVLMTRNLVFGGSLIKNDVNYCCPDADQCYTIQPASATLIGNKYGCWYKNSVAYGDQKSYLCTDYDDTIAFVQCDQTYEKNKFYSNNKFFCDGTKWNVCDSKTQSTTANGVNPNQYFCDGTQWTECTNILRGAYTSDNKRWCDGKSWSTEFLINSESLMINGKSYESLYETRIVKESGSKTIIYTNPSSTLTKNNVQVTDDKGNKLSIMDLKVCPSDIDLGQIDLCVNLLDNNELKEIEPSTIPVIDSVQRLNTGAKKPYVYANNLMYLYFQDKEPKMAQIILTVDVPETEKGQGLKLIDRNAFFKNLLNGQSLGFQLDGQYYLMYYDSASQKGFWEGLVLEHIPTLTKFSSQYIPENKFQFTLHADRAIILELGSYPGIGPYLGISSGKPSEAVAQFPNLYNLKTEFEVPFSRDNPVQLEDLQSAKITVCEADRPQDQFLMEVCINDDITLTLQNNKLTNYKINDIDVAFLYQYDSGKKGYVFKRDTIGTDKDNHLGIDYADLVNDLAAGRRLALTFEDHTYLMEHQGSDFSIRNLRLMDYAGIADDGSKITNPAPALGSEKAVEFGVNDGKIFFNREFLNPPPPFQIYGLTNEMLQNIPLDMNKELFTTVTSVNPVNLNNPFYGIIKKSENDIPQIAASFRLQYTDRTSTIQEIKLNRNEPLVIGNDFPVLFYYSNAQIVNEKFVKTAEIYLVKDVSVPTDTIDLTSEWIDTFTGGRELALKFGSNYYILGYSGSTGKQFFELNKLTLRTLTGEKIENLQTDVSGLNAKFTVPEGDINIQLDDTLTPPKLRFSAEGKEELLTKTFVPSDNFSITLTNENKIKISNTNKRYYCICDSEDTKSESNLVYLCESNSLQKCENHVSTELQLGKPQKIEEIYPNSVNKNLMITYYHYSDADNKKSILFQQVFTPETFNELNGMSWSKLVNNFKEQRYPLLSWIGKYFELSGGSSLASLHLRDLFDDEYYGIKMHSTISGKNNGTFVAETGEQLSLWQELKDKKITLFMEKLVPKYISAEGINVTANSLFTIKISGEEYHLNLEVPSTYDPKNPVPVRVMIESVDLFVNALGSHLIYTGFLPLKEVRKVLFPDGTVLTLEVLDKDTVRLKNEEAE